MTRRATRTLGKWLVMPAIALLMLTGCGGGDSLPDTVTINLPDGSEVETTLGSGVISLADSRWQLTRGPGASAQGLAFVVVRFGPNGELAAFENNTLASDIFGSELIFDGETHETTQAGLTYAAATYGAETIDSQGFAFEGLLSAYVPIVGEVAVATASASGEFDGEDIDTIRGTFEFVSDVTNNVFDLVPEPYLHMEESFTFTGTRIIE